VISRIHVVGGHQAAPTENGSTLLQNSEEQMNIEVNEQEKALILELIESAEQETIQGIDRADIRAFKTLLRSRLELLESMRDRIQLPGSQASHVPM
jgi:hypothetical protein